MSNKDLERLKLIADAAQKVLDTGRLPDWVPDPEVKVQEALDGLQNALESDPDVVEDEDPEFEEDIS
jgi:hypothetical protein